MNHKTQLWVRYSHVGNVHKDHQKRIRDAFDLIFEKLDMDNLERTNNLNEYEKRYSI